MQHVLEAAAKLIGLEPGAARSSERRPLFVILATEPRMKELNRTFLGHAGATDVLAFDLRSQSADAPLEDDTPLAEIYVCPAVAVRAARDYNTSVSREIVLYVVHGMLHLAGHDDHTDHGVRRMRRAEKRVLGQLAADGCRLDDLFAAGNGPCRQTGGAC